MASQTRKNVGRDLILFIGSVLNSCGLLLLVPSHVNDRFWEEVIVPPSRRGSQVTLFI